MDTTRFTLATAFIALLLTLDVATGQVPGWTDMSPTPTSRASHAMAFDSSRGRTVVFGGVGNGRIDLDAMFHNRAGHSR